MTAIFDRDEYEAIQRWFDENKNALPIEIISLVRVSLADWERREREETARREVWERVQGVEVQPSS